MKKFRLISAVSVAVLTMSVQAMAAPLNTNVTSLCAGNTTLKTCMTNLCSNNDSTSKNCTTTLDIESILQGMNCSMTSPSFNFDLSKALEDMNSCADGSCDDNSCADGSCETTTKNTPANDSAANNNTASKPVADNDTTNSKPSNTVSSSISAYAQQVVNLVNQERAKQGISPLEIDLDVTAAAQVRAKEVQTTFAHTRPDGRSCFTALDEAGVSYNGAGENIALGQKTPEQVVNDWMNSEGHRKNILNSNFKYIGVGVDGTAWTQLFTY